MKPQTKRLMITVAILTGLSTLGCGMFVDRAVNKAMDTAANRVGERVGGAIADNVIGKLQPEMMHLYTMAVFRMLFYHGGYHVANLDYKPGQFTRWQATNVEQGDWFERTLLHRYSNKSEWWRVESKQKDNDGKQQVLIMEALLSPAKEDGSRQVRRMRALFPGEKEHREIPITEANSSKWRLYTNGALTEESLKGMTKGKKSIKVPAGEFSATHVQMKGYQEQNKVDWFMVPTVPGQVVKYQSISKDGDKDKITWTVSLLAYGGDKTTSKLDIDFKQNDPASKTESTDTKTEKSETK